MQILGVLILAGTVYLSLWSMKRNPNLKNLWVFVGFIMFVMGVLNLVVNSVGIYYGFLGWIEQMGKLGSFLFKLGMIFCGIAIVVLVTHDEDAYDEYYDGDKYQ